MTNQTFATIHPNVRQIMEPPPMCAPWLLVAYWNRRGGGRWKTHGTFTTEGAAKNAAQLLATGWMFYRIYKLEL